VANEPRGGLVEMHNRPTTLVDSNVLLDVMTDDPLWAEWSSDRIAQALDAGRLVISPIIYAEVSTGFERIEDLDDALPESEFEREPLPYEAGFLAGKAYIAYRRRDGSRRSPMPDFYIGAHAAVRSYRLLTRDSKRYSTYFPGVELIAP
jgi:predicted nucleic acid-binding protein